MSIFCKVGLHKWILLGTDFPFLNEMKQCKRCKIGSHFVLGVGEIKYTSEAMREAWHAGKISNEAARYTLYGPALE